MDDQKRATDSLEDAFEVLNRLKLLTLPMLGEGFTMRQMYMATAQMAVFFGRHLHDEQAIREAAAHLRDLAEQLDLADPQHLDVAMYYAAAKAKTDRGTPTEGG